VRAQSVSQDQNGQGSGELRRHSERSGRERSDANDPGHSGEAAADGSRIY